MPLVTTQPIVLTDAASTPVNHTYTYHHQDVREPLTGIYVADTATDKSPNALHIKHTESKGRYRSLAQIVTYENIGTEEVPDWQPVVMNVTISRPKSGSVAFATAAFAQVGDLTTTAGFAAGFLARNIQ